jgi:DNA-binding response OmpR family regulator
MPTSSPAPKRILLLEDDRRIAAALQTRLHASGYEVFHAPDAVMGTLLASTHAPDLILSDIWMPVMQGFTFVRRMNGLGLPSVPVIFITASNAPGLKEKALSMGAAGYIQKPFDSAELLALVERALGDSQPAQAA